MLVWTMLLALAPRVLAEEVDESEDQESFKVSQLWQWPFENVVQPLLNGLIYPIAKPIDYVVSNQVVETSIDLITFGERDQIMVYPSFNFKPGVSTLIGANYRHRSIFFNYDYLVFQTNYFANGDLSMTLRYSKQSLFGTSFFMNSRFDFDWDRDNQFVFPETKRSYTQPDSSFAYTLRLGRPLTKSGFVNAELWSTIRYNDASLPDVNDSVLIDVDFPIYDRGLYQKEFQIPLGFSLFYDDLDCAYAPSKGKRVGITAFYTHVFDYTGLDREALEEDFGLNYYDKSRSQRKEHDFIKTEVLFQHYLYFGSSENYILSATEARESRKFYTDFSWDETMRVWRPENVRNTLLERRVIAFQYRLVDLWELEKGGAPYNAFTTLNARTPLRGYADSWSTHHLMSFSWEYRWPVDRFVDGVFFDEYALISPTFDGWSFSNYYNSWGFGIRVRQPNMYLFRVQFGFHGLHGINLVMTIAPEFR